MATPRYKVLRLAATALVLLPFWWAGATGLGIPVLPWQVREIWAFSALFTHGQPSFPSHHIQLLGRDRHWHEVPHGPPFEHALFGSQTRLDWLLLYLGSEPENAADRERLATVGRHLCGSYAALYATGPLADERLPPEALPVKRARLLRLERYTSLERPPAKPYSRALPEHWRRGNHEILFECAVPPRGEAQ